MIYVGGCGRLDLWSYPEHDKDTDTVRIVWGERGTDNWHWASWSTEKPVMVMDNPSGNGLSNAPTSEEMEAASIYVRLFAPSLVPSWVLKMKEDC